MSYINTAKRLLGEHGRLELCALGIALAPLVTVAGRHLCFYCCSGEQLHVCTAVQVCWCSCSQGNPESGDLSSIR